MTDYNGNTYIDVYVDTARPQGGSGVDWENAYSSFLEAWTERGNIADNFYIWCRASTDVVDTDSLPRVSMAETEITNLVIHGDFVGTNGSVSGIYTMAGDENNVLLFRGDDAVKELHVKELLLKLPTITPLPGNGNGWFDAFDGGALWVDRCYINIANAPGTTSPYQFRQRAGSKLYVTNNIVNPLFDSTNGNAFSVHALNMNDSADEVLVLNNNLFHLQPVGASRHRGFSIEEQLVGEQHLSNNILLMEVSENGLWGGASHRHTLYTGGSQGTHVETKQIAYAKRLDYWVDPDNADYTLKDSDNPDPDILDAGENVESSTGHPYDINHIDRNTAGAEWDIGASEYISDPFPNVYEPTQQHIDDHSSNPYWIGNEDTVLGNRFSFAAVTDIHFLPVTIDAEGFFIVHSNGVYVDDAIEFAIEINDDWQETELKTFTITAS